MQALVVDGHMQSALAAVRSLGRRGVRVVVGSVGAVAMARQSRFCSAAFRYPDPEMDPRGFVAAVAAAVRAHEGPSVILFCSDATALPLSRFRSELPERARLLLPTAERVEVAFDKAKTLARAHALGVPVPESWERLDDVELPAVVKPRHSVTWRERGRAVSDTAHIVSTRSELDDVVRNLRSTTGEEPIVQELLRGDESGYFGLWRDGEPLATFAHRRLRSLRLTGGASVLREAVLPHPVAEKAALDLMRDLSWTGLAMVEFKVRGATGVPTLMEINGRLWGSLPLAVAAGVDFPWLAWQLATTGSTGPVTDYVVGTRCRNLVGDARHLLASVQRGPIRERLNTTREFLRMSEPGLHYDVASREDPVPFFAQFVEKGLRRWRR
jgi:predicted ATP-grasp superfamily ATP-dependent carboligase